METTVTVSMSAEDAQQLIREFESLIGGSCKCGGWYSEDFDIDCTEWTMVVEMVGQISKAGNV